MPKQMLSAVRGNMPNDRCRRTFNKNDRTSQGRPVYAPTLIQSDGGMGRMVMPVSRCSVSIRSGRSVRVSVVVTA